MAWTNEMVESLRRMWTEGKSANEIAKILNVSKNSIVGKVHRLCLTARPSPIKKKDENSNVAEIKEEAVEEILTDAPEDILPESQPENKISDKTKHRKSKKNIKLVELDSHTCRWPLGDPRDDDFGFCGKKVRSGQTYCDEHSQVAYVKATLKK